MNDYKHLKDRTYYEELYDRLTVDECKRWEAREKEEVKAAKKRVSKKEKLKNDLKVKVVLPTALYFIKGENYRKRSKTIDEWMVRDKARDEKVANAVEPEGIRCLNCSSHMDCINHDLHTDIDDKKDRVLFFFECPDCHKRRAYWEGGQEWEPSPYPCPKCKTNRVTSRSSKGDIITTVYTCPKCGHKEKDTMDLSEKIEEKIDPNFEADRKKYCMTEKEGMEYIDAVEKLKHAAELIKDRVQNKDTYNAIAKIKKLTIAELQNLLNPVIEKAGYIKFELGKPEVQRDVVVEFSLQDNKPGRSEYDSAHGLQKLIKNALEDTNWRLMSDGVNYRLGFLSGRLRGVEGEDRLRELVAKKTPK